MFICEIWLFDWYFPQFCKSDTSKYGYLEVFQRVPSTLRYRESTVDPSRSSYWRIKVVSSSSSFAKTILQGTVNGNWGRARQNKKVGKQC